MTCRKQSVPERHTVIPVPFLPSLLTKGLFQARRRGPHLGSLEQESATEVQLQLKVHIYVAVVQFERGFACSLLVLRVMEYPDRFMQCLARDCGDTCRH